MCPTRHTRRFTLAASGLRALDGDLGGSKNAEPGERRPVSLPAELIRLDEVMDHTGALYRLLVPPRASIRTSWPGEGVTLSLAPCCAAPSASACRNDAPLPLLRSGPSRPIPPYSVPLFRDDLGFAKTGRDLLSPEVTAGPASSAGRGRFIRPDERKLRRRAHTLWSHRIAAARSTSGGPVRAPLTPQQSSTKVTSRTARQNG